MYWSIVYVYTCMTEQLAENIQPDAPIGLVLEHLYRTAGFCVAVRQYIYGKPSARTSGPRPTSGRSSDACNSFAWDAPRARIRSRASKSRPVARDRSRASDCVRPSTTRSPSRLRPRHQACRAPSPSTLCPPLAVVPSPPRPCPPPHSVSAAPLPLS